MEGGVTCSTEAMALHHMSHDVKLWSCQSEDLQNYFHITVLILLVSVRCWGLHNWQGLPEFMNDIFHIHPKDLLQPHLYLILNAFAR